MTQYKGQEHYLVAVDCIIFGFDGEHLNLLLIKRGFEPKKNKWSLMGGFVQPTEDLDGAAKRILHQLTGLKGVYLEQLKAFGQPKRDPEERTISISYFALIDINQYKEKISDTYAAEWFPLKKYPKLIFDHDKMIELAKGRLRYKASLHPILFELLPEKFTMPQLQNLYEDVYDTSFDKRNFSRKVLSTSLLVKLNDKDMSTSKKGAFYYKLNKKQYTENFHSFLKFIPNPDHLL
ncbi:ADP-ribose pyrophosphatase YjhB, NUDIX family [Arachidicoccus rhizosphaerae]|uniref:ADP-ribose pyrophosphatase YjhB, NUDIX family n=1 Tax=Arachidicoccus rhizosphaerae TaxID=551991 RepID=A0A1H3ZVG3_9BACT|nr:NUDIX domain-containing protein [Arachidicoccus rhizosphaerae]SEA27262.1 ADP-ribose pyrophosphatase YjhB, NUDIX family [Arachidicoccus rhizosphaerae]